MVRNVVQNNFKDNSTNNINVININAMYYVLFTLLLPTELKKR